jgi:hypothetical protein
MSRFLKAFHPEDANTITKDFRIFTDPGFLTTVGLVGGLMGAIAGVLLYFSAG